MKILAALGALSVLAFAPASFAEEPTKPLLVALDEKISYEPCEEWKWWICQCPEQGEGNRLCPNNE